MNFSTEGLNMHWAIRKLICSSYAEKNRAQHFTYHKTILRKFGTSVPNTEVKQSKASVCLPANNGIMCSNPILGKSMCLCSSHLCCHMCAAALWQANILSECPTRYLALRFWNLKKGETLHCFHTYQRIGEIGTELDENVKSTTWEVFGLNSGWLWQIILHYIH